MKYCIFVDLKVYCRGQMTNVHCVEIFPRGIRKSSHFMYKYNLSQLSNSDCDCFMQLSYIVVSSDEIF